MRILYLINATWSWIKQRPHFLAEGLSDHFDLTVVAKKDFIKYVHNDTEKVKLHYLKRLPLESRLSSIVVPLNNILYFIQLRSISKKYDVIWLSNPLQYRFVKSSLEGKKVIYDCMDDMVELQKCDEDRRKVLSWEKQLYERADMVLCSANHLRDVLYMKYGQRDVVVVNNAIKDGIDTEACVIPNDITFDGSKVNITYIGTIASWMDYDLIKRVLKDNQNVVFNMFGPIDDRTVPEIEGVVFHGSIEHKYVAGIMKKSDILIMPFIVNDLIKSVNPVKLYEYIYSGKACMAPRYGESECFEDFVYLYDDAADCSKIIQQLIQNNCPSKQSPEKGKKFALNNTWSKRVEQICAEIKKIIK